MSDFLEGQYTIDDVAETMGELPTRVITGIYVGDRDAYNAVRHLPSWSFCLAAQSFHRELLGYKGRGAPKDSPNYSYAIVDNTFYANLVDADNVKYVDPELIERMLTWCLGEYGQHRTLLVACDRGQSRSPTIALMLLRRLGGCRCWRSPIHDEPDAERGVLSWDCDARVFGAVVGKGIGNWGLTSLR